MRAGGTGILIRRAAARAGAAKAPSPAMRAPLAPEKALALALGRGGLDELGLGLEVLALDLAVQGQAELLEGVEPLSLVAMLQGPEDALAVMVLDTAMLAGVLEIQTTGKVGQEAPEPRRPTRTDAAMCAALIDRVLAAFEAGFDGAAPRWGRGFRYAGFLADPRPLALMLDDGGFHVFRARLDLGPGAREAGLLLAFPDIKDTAAAATAASGRAASAAPPGDGLGQGAVPLPGWHVALQQAVMEAPVRLEAVLARLRLPLSQAMTLRAGDILDLPDAGLERIELRAGAGRVIIGARLGQLRSHRALRLGAMDDMAETAAAAEPPAGGTPAPLDDIPDEATPHMLRQTG